MTRPRAVRVAVCQVLGIDGDRDGNFRRIEHALEAARAGGAAMAAFPESILLGWQNPDAHRLASPIPGPDTDRIAALARRGDMAIAIGLDEKDGDELYDSAVLVAADGRLLWKHRKLNVLPELMEPPYAQGVAEAIGAVDTPVGRVGMLVCADTFEDAYVARVAAARPDLVVVPYGWAADPDAWPSHARVLEELVVRRAREWRAPVVAVNLVGAMTRGPWSGRTFGGASLVADASGEVIARLRDRDVEVRVVDVPLARRSG
jgi:predicted amidohydrolase